MTRFKAKRIDNGEWIDGYVSQAELGMTIRVTDHTLPYNAKYVDPSTLQQEIGGEWYTMDELRIKVEDFYPFLEQRVESLQVNNAQLKAEVERLTTIIQHGLGDRDIKDDTITPIPCTKQRRKPYITALLSDGGVRMLSIATKNHWF